MCCIPHGTLRMIAVITLAGIAVGVDSVVGQEVLTGEYRQSWALLIGVNTTPGMQALDGVRDAETMEAALQQVGFPKTNIKVLRNPKAEEIRHELYYAFKRMAKNDRYLVYFSGHGEEFVRTDGSREGYLLASNTDLGSLHTTAIAMDDLKSIGLRVPAKHVLFILDACYSGLAIEKAKDDDTRAAPVEVKPLIRRPVVQILVAGTGDQKAYQVANQGVFTKWVVEGLQFLPETGPTKPLTFTKFVAWVQGEVSRDSRGRLTPRSDRFSGNGEFVLMIPGTVAPGPAVASKPPEATRLKENLATGVAPAPQVTRPIENLARGTVPPQGPSPGDPSRSGQVERSPLETASLPAEVSGRDSAPMMLVPSGPFWMGSTEAEVSELVRVCARATNSEPYCRERYAVEIPRHRVTLDAYYIDKYEVSHSLYGKFLTATRSSPPPHFSEADPRRHGNRPVVAVNWDSAAAYCRWAGKRLPTEAEWEKAARGTDGRKYPWGNAVPTPVLASYDPARPILSGGMQATRHWSGYETLSPVDSFPDGKSPYGVYNLAGNVIEWVSDRWGPDYYKHSPERNPPGPGESGTFSSGRKVFRGGGWNSTSEELRSAGRAYLDAMGADGNLFGFRCVQEAATAVTGTRR